MGKLIMGYWDCQYCDTKGIPGDSRECTCCGHPRDESVSFYLKDMNYVSEEKAATISRKPDWYCPFCNTLNNAELTECKGCGAPRGDSEKNYFDLKAEKAKKQSEELLFDSEEPRPQTGKNAKSNTPLNAINKVSGKRSKIFGIAALALIALFAIFVPKKKDVEVTGLSWERDIKIEQYANVDEDDWSLPQDANLHTTKLEIHHYDHVIDHYIDVQVERSREVLDGYDTHTRTVDLGNGYFEEEIYETPRYRTEYYTEIETQPVYRDDPVYATKYYYDIWKWIPSRKVSTSGDDHNAYWGEVNLAENEREDTRNEKYTVTFTGKKNKKYTYEIPIDEWMGYDIGNKFKIKTQTGSKKFEIVE